MGVRYHISLCSRTVTVVEQKGESEGGETVCGDIDEKEDCLEGGEGKPGGKGGVE